MCGPAEITGTTAGAITAFSSSQLHPKADQTDSKRKAVTDRIFYTFKFIEPAQKQVFVATRLISIKLNLSYEIFNLIALFLVPDAFKLEPMLDHNAQLDSLQLYKRGDPAQRRKIPPIITRAADYFSINCNHEIETHRKIFFKTMVEKKAMTFIISAINALTQNGWTKTPEGRKMQLDLLTVLSKVIENDSQQAYALISPEFLKTLFNILKQQAHETTRQSCSPNDDKDDVACVFLKKIVKCAKNNEEGETILRALLDAGILDLATDYMEFSVKKDGNTAVLAHSAGPKSQTLIDDTNDGSDAQRAASPESSQQGNLVKERVNLLLSQLFVIFSSHVSLLQWNDSKRMVNAMNMLPLPQNEIVSENEIKIIENSGAVVFGILLLLSDETCKEGIELLSERVPLHLFCNLTCWLSSLLTPEEKNLLTQQTVIDGLLNLFRGEGSLKPTLLKLSYEFYHEKEKLRKKMLFGTDEDKVDALPIALKHNNLLKEIKTVPGEFPRFIDKGVDELVSSFLKTLDKKQHTTVPMICTLANFMVIDEIYARVAVYIAMTWDNYEWLLSAFNFPVNQAGEAITINEKDELLVNTALQVLILLLETDTRVCVEIDRGNTNLTINPCVQMLKDFHLPNLLIKFMHVPALEPIVRDVINR